MKLNKRIALTAILMVLLSTLLTPFQEKVSRAADYLSAPTLPLNGAWSGEYYLTETDDEQWYKLIIPSDGELQLGIMSYFYDCCWKLYNSDLTESFNTGYYYDNYVSGEETTPTTNKLDFVLSTGTYYVKIDSYHMGKYKLYARFTSYGVNDQTAVSYVSPLVYSLGSTVTGALTETDIEDWYKITIPTSGYYSQKIVSYFDCDWWLYNSDLTKRIDYGSVEGEATTPKTDKTDFVLSKGTYYVKIDSYYAGKYTFQFTTLTKQSCSHDYSSTWHDATYFKRGYYSYRCKKCGHTYKGDYEPVKKLEQGYLYSYCSAGKGKLKLSWSTVSDASGYQIRYAKNRSMKRATVKTVKGQSKTGKTIKKLSRRKKYYVQIRAYKKSGGKTVYGKWSGKRCFKTK